jgi:hypothetical protein
MKAVMLAAAALLFFQAAAFAVPVQQNSQLSAEDKSEIDALEKKFFDMMEKRGIEETLRKFLIEGGANEIPNEIAEQARILDDACGTVIEVQRTTERNQGTHFVQKRYVTAFNECLVYWKLDYTRIKTKWNVTYFLFNTEEKEL